MRIAMDARALAGPRSGLFVYTESILSAMQAAAPDVEWTLYSHAPIACPELAGERVALRFPGQTLLRSWWMRFRLLPHLGRHRPDIWFSPLSAALPAPIAPSVVVVHDLAMLRFPGIMPAHYHWSWKRALRHAAARADHVIAVSQSTSRDLVELLGADEKRITVVHEAADECFFQPLPEEQVRAALGRLGASEGAKLEPGYLLYPATLEPRKNHAMLVSLFLDLHARKETRRRLVLVGGRGWGDNRKALGLLRGVAERLPDRPVVWLRTADRDELRALYAGARLLVFPSRYEGFGLPVVEAMAANVPVVASNVSSLPEVVGEAGVLLPPEDVGAWRQALRALPEDEARLAAMRQAGLVRARAFSWEKAARTTLAILREAAR